MLIRQTRPGRYTFGAFRNVTYQFCRLLNPAWVPARSLGSGQDGVPVWAWTGTGLRRCSIRPALHSSQRWSVDANRASALMVWMLREWLGGRLVSLPRWQFRTVPAAAGPAYGEPAASAAAIQCGEL